ncbi:MAG: alanine--tRNA ligase, partial [Dehalococcoidia bacterium]|nr:alanine--tRNA ligase [Dehalococcoidia bacterium]
HTATHLLQAALRQVMGSHVQQRGSLVMPKRLRFDFSHLGTVNREQLCAVEDVVNDKIRQNLTVVCDIMSYDEAVAQGATALFGEKYGEKVRVVSAGEPPFSVELCGGTHVSSTGEIGFFHIVSEGSIGSGLRRIEAVTGRGALEFVKTRLLSLESIAGDLKTTPEEVRDKVLVLASELDAGRKRVAGLQRQLSGKISESLIDNVEMASGVKVLSAKVSVTDMDAMREMGDMLKGKLGSGVIVLGAIFNGRPNFIAMVTPDIVSKGVHAGKLVKQIAMVTGGGGGGKPELGQAGGKDKGKIDQALSMTGKMVKKALE